MNIKEAENIINKLKQESINPKSQKAIALIETTLNAANNLTKIIKRNSRVNLALKKRAYIKSKFYDRLKSEATIKLCLLMSLYYTRTMMIRSQPMPKFENGGMIIGENEI